MSAQAPLKDENNEKSCHHPAPSIGKSGGLCLYSRLLSRHATLTRGYVKKTKIRIFTIPGDSFRFTPNRFRLGPKINCTLNPIDKLSSSDHFISW